MATIINTNLERMLFGVLEDFSDANSTINYVTMIFVITLK